MKVNKLYFSTIDTTIVIDKNNLSVSLVKCFNPLNAELNPICHLLALGAHHILHVGRIRVNAVAVGKG
jgi:hypothetical protein